MRKFNYIYGPLPSWRLGRSLGVDPVSSVEKRCTFDCVYCQLGRKDASSGRRKVYVKTEDIIKELRALPKVKIDYVTFSGSGEPTLAKNLGELIKAIKKLRRERIAVLTNASLINRPDVQRELSLADFVVAKLDTSEQVSFNRINGPVSGVNAIDIIQGIKRFRRRYKGRLGLQIMFMANNRKEVGRLASIAAGIGPDEVQINTPLRPCGLRPLSRGEISKIKKQFLRTAGLKTDVVTVYEATRKRVSPLNSEDVLRRRRKL